MIVYPNSKEDASPLPCRGPKRGRKCCVTPAFSGIPNKGVQNQKSLPHPCLLGGQKRAEMLHHLGIVGGSSTKGTKIRSGCLTLAFLGAQKGAEMLCHPFILGDSQQTEPNSEEDASPLPSQGPTRWWKCDITPAFLGIPNKGMQNQKWLPSP